MDIGRSVVEGDRTDIGRSEAAEGDRTLSASTDWRDREGARCRSSELAVLRTELGRWCIAAIMASTRASRTPTEARFRVDGSAGKNSAGISLDIFVLNCQ